MISENGTTDEVATVELGAVIYTDGSCKMGVQNSKGYSGYIGWGSHGYIYKANSKDKPIMIENHFLTNKGYVRVGTEKSFLTSDGFAYVEPVSYLDYLGSSASPSTNNAAELMAFCYSVEHLKDKNLKTISVFTDSEYLRKGLNDWCKSWERYNWRRPDNTYIPNHELWIKAYGLYKDLKNSGVHININWVKGHNDIFGNIHADVLAGIASNYSIGKEIKNSFTETDPKGYWKNEVDRHPFINHKTLYFNSVSEYNTPGCYFQADNAGVDLSIGKRMPETGLSVIQLKDADPAIEAVKRRQYRVAKDSNAIILMKLDRVYSKEIYPYIMEHGEFSLIPGKGNLNVNWFDKKPVTIEQDPTKLSLRAIESFNLLEDLLTKFCKSRDSGFTDLASSVNFNVHDITSTFYNVEEKEVKNEIVKKFTLKPEYVVGFTNMFLDIEEPYEDRTCTLKVPLILGTDLIPRNNLKKLEAINPKIYLITWREAKNSIRYATVIDCDTGIGIWSNFYADKIFFQ